jgi:hypothetical protein
MIRSTACDRAAFTFSSLDARPCRESDDATIESELPIRWLTSDSNASTRSFSA